MSSTAHRPQPKIIAMMVAEHPTDTAVASAEPSTAMVSFQRI